MGPGTHEGIFCRFAIPDETGYKRTGELGSLLGALSRAARCLRGGRRYGKRAHLALASLTLIRGRARSSLKRWLCSVRRRSLSSDIDCLWGREFMVDD